MRTDTITILKPFDRHLHLRQGQMLENVMPYALRSNFGAVIMGNIAHPNETSTLAKAIAYRAEIMRLVPRSANFMPVMTCYLTDDITPDEVVRGYEEGVWRAVKLYLASKTGKDGTTNSGHGVKNLSGRGPVFAAMEKAGIPLLGHWETVEPGIDIFDREIVSVTIDLEPIIKAFPGLKIVFEHITDSRAADFVVAAGENVFATVTPHHLLVNRNAMYAGGLNAVNYCLPVPKRERHRVHIRKLVTSGHPRVGAGTDSAPHDETAKSRSTGCAAGIFLPKAVEMYATVFDEENAMEHFEAFISRNFLDIYGIEPSKETITLVREPTAIPEVIGGIRVFMGGETLPWKLVEPQA